MTQPNVIIYSTPTCHFRHAAKEFFAANGITFTDHNVATDLEKRKEMIAKSGQMGVPVITVEDPSNPSGQAELIVGFDEAKLKELLAV